MPLKALRELLDEERVIRSKLDEINKRKEEAEASFELEKGSRFKQ